MDPSERIAKAYLESLELGQLAYEPSGQVPPDFALGDIGVEVRRLNQNFEEHGSYEGLESAQASLIRFVKTTLRSFGVAPQGKGWWVFYHFWRPLDGKAVKRALPEALEAFQAAPSPQGADFRLTRTFELEIRPASISVEHFYMLGGFADRDSGGFVASEIIRNLNLCIAEKASKIAPYRDRYREWWLVLPDHIGPDLDADEKRTIGEHVDLKIFSRVALVHPQRPTLAFVLTPPNSGR